MDDELSNRYLCSEHAGRRQWRRNLSARDPDYPDAGPWRL